MPIQTKDRYFGEGISAYGQADPREAFIEHLNHVRTQRLKDAFGDDKKFDNSIVAREFAKIVAAMQAADQQVLGDNAEFIRTHGIKTDGLATKKLGPVAA